MTMPASERRHRSQDHLTDAQLNELVDGTFTAPETERVNEHLAACAECDERYRTLLATVSALQSASSLMPRRSFRLTPAQAIVPEPTTSWLDRFSQWVLPGVPLIRAATLAVALLLISVTVADVLVHRDTGQESAGSIAVQTARETSDAAPALQNAAETSTLAPAPTAFDTSLAGQVGESAPMRSQEEPESADTASELDSVSVTEGAEDSVDMAAPAPAAMQPASVSIESSPPATQVVPSASPSAASPTAIPAASESPGHGSRSVSSWRIVELGLLLLLLWLGVSWIGRARMRVPADDPGNQP